MSAIRYLHDYSVPFLFLTAISAVTAPRPTISTFKAAISPTSRCSMMPRHWRPSRKSAPSTCSICLFLPRSDCSISRICRGHQSGLTSIERKSMM
ncbi:hypothetical protein B0H66DRAFT_551275 [Apodospora peruviana]|uniref:Uncharacterized protein n=1 Tax=Apodospora peruviana TaxID=516989 RepID=A0AAE0IK22_9PEZI|nr:hypothetical protein B0H66DRAFT_551275 [Apodospora peruviana]